jgi:hypothetical protein
MLRDKKVKFLIRLSTVLLGITCIFFFVVTLNSQPLPRGAPNYELDHIVRPLFIVFGLPLTLGMGALWWYVGRSWEEIDDATRTIIAVVTLLPLPFLLYAAFWSIVFFIGGLLIAAFFIYVFSNQLSAMHRPPYYYHRHHRHGHKHCRD